MSEQNKSLPLTNSELDELARLEKTATPGPWYALEHYPSMSDRGGRVVAQGYSIMLADCRIPDEHDLNDCKFVAAARNAMPHLLAELRRLREVEARIEAIAKDVGA